MHPVNAISSGWSSQQWAPCRPEADVEDLYTAMARDTPSLSGGRGADEFADWLPTCVAARRVRLRRCCHARRALGRTLSLSRPLRTRERSVAADEVRDALVLTQRVLRSAMLALRPQPERGPCACCPLEPDMRPRPGRPTGRPLRGLPPIASVQLAPADGAEMSGSARRAAARRLRCPRASDSVVQRADDASSAVFVTVHSSPVVSIVRFGISPRQGLFYTGLAGLCPSK